MKKTDRRDFIKTMAAGGIGAIGASAFASPSRSMSGMREVQRARGNVAASLPLVDSFCQMPADKNGIDNFIKATETYGVRGNLFVPSKLEGDWNAVKAYNRKTSKLAAQTQNAKFAGMLHPGTTIEESKAELKKCKSEYGFAAVMLPFWDSAQVLYPFGWSIESLLETATELNMPLILPKAVSGNAQDGLRDLVLSVLGMKKSSNLKIILSDFGGTFTWEMAKKGEALPDDNPFYFYAGEKISAAAFKCFKNVFGSGRILFGSCGNMNYAETLKNLENLSLSSGDFKKACFENANRLFGFDVKE